MRFFHCLSVSTCPLLLSVGFAAPAAPGEPSAFREDFERGLVRWACPWPGKNPLLIHPDPERPDNQCAYSGPPGARRVARHEFDAPVTGRIELRFYDDLAEHKNQMAGVGDGKDEILGIACSGGTHYRRRIGKTYHTTSVPRTRGWHRFSWVADGRRTTAFIDGRKIAVNPRLGAVRSLFIGSFWDASTGWYDDVSVTPAPPSDAPWAVRAADAWSKKPDTTVWLLKAPKAGPALLLLRFGRKSAGRTFTIRCGRRSTPLALPSVSAEARSGIAAAPVETDGGPTFVSISGKDFDPVWLALGPANLQDPPGYARDLDWFLSTSSWLNAAWRMTADAAKSAGVALKNAVGRIPQFEEIPPADVLASLRRSDPAALAEARRSVIAALTPRFRDWYAVQPARIEGNATPPAQECFHRLNRYVRLTAPRFRDWPHAEGCRYHKREGHAEWDVRQNATVALGYAALLRGPYDEKVGGVSRKQLKNDLVGLLRLLAVTHKSNFVPTGDGAPWGDQWQSAFWAGIAGQAAWLVWDELPDDVRVMAARMIEHEADRFNTRPPDSGWHGDTKAEENAWNSEVIALAACMFPQHPHRDMWRERAIVYMLNSLVRKTDHASDAVVDGKPLAARLTAVTLYPDYTLENHNRVHPDYLASGALLLRNALLYRAAGLRIPQSMFFNVRETYRVLKHLTSADGACFYVNGQDWWPHRHDVPLLISAFVSVLFDDPEAAFIERAALETFRRMHARFDDGRAWDRREYNYANAEEEMIARYAEIYLLHRMFGDGPKPVSRREFLERQAGTYVFETGGFAIRRSPSAFASFAWVNGAMGLVYPGDDTWFTAPYERGFVGSIRCRGLPDGRPEVTAHHVQTGDGMLSVSVRLKRCDGSVEQRGAMVALPDGRVVWFERWRALEPIDVEWVRSGALGILNEDAPGMEDNRRVLFSAEGPKEIVGASQAPSRILRISSRWVNIEGRLGVLSSGPYMEYLDENRYSRSRLREVLWPLVSVGVGRVAAGGVFHRGAVLFLPECSVEETAAASLEFEAAGTDVWAVRLDDGRIVATNLSDKPVRGRVFSVAVTLGANESGVFPTR